METYYSKNVSDLENIAKNIIKHYPSERIFAFYGEMGAGKTTLIIEMCKYLESNDIVSSPTFAIINEYRTKKNKPIYHFDFYRIKNLIEAYDLGYEDYFYSGEYCFIEWTEKIEDLLPTKFVKVRITENDGLRSIETQLVNN